MKALHRVDYPRIKEETPSQKTANAENQRFLNTNFKMIEDELYAVNLFIDSVADYQVAQGLSGTWYYRSYANGRIEAWGKTVEDTAAILTATGSLYTTTKELDFPAIFGNVDFAEVQAISSNAVMTSISAHDAETITVHLLSATQSTVTLSFFIHVIGRV